jgi:hypothetical protein
MTPANDTAPLDLRDALKLSLITVQPRLPDARYCELHQRCAAGTITEDEEAELNMLCAEKERAWEEANAIHRGEDAPNEGPERANNSLRDI